MALNCGILGKRILLIFIILILILGIASNVLYFYINHPGPLASSKVLVIHPHTSIKNITKQLYQENIISYPLVFQLTARLTGYFYKLKAGEYAFDTAMTPQQIFKMLIEGRYVVHSITFPEGLTVKQIITLLNNEPLLKGTINLNIKEGSLFPDTYFFYYGQQRQHIIDNMQKKMILVVDEIWQKRDLSEDLPIKTKEELIILASIIEKETAIREEQKRIAAVFINRLNKGMKLQADPTIIYAITDGLGYLGRPLTKSDLEQPSEFNTYMNFALPPTAIANPGKTALEAVVSHLKTKELFFVADPENKGHKFTEKLLEHNQNVYNYRNKLKQMKKIEGELIK